jgi:hypothetical protein
MAVTKSRRALLPGRFDPTGTFRSPERVHLRTISFRILVHAEIEAFLEDRTRDLMDAAWGHWQTSRLPSEVIVGTLAYSAIETSLPPKSLGESSNKKAYDDIGVPLQKAQNVWRFNHTNNHGIKKENVLMLLLPLGVQHSKLDTTLLADLSSYGVARGEVAHRSNYTTTAYADPKSEYDRATKLVADIEKLDKLIDVAITRVHRFATI